MHIHLDISNALSFLPGGSLEAMEPVVGEAHDRLLSGSGPGSDFLGWIRLPSRTDPALLHRIREEAMRIRELADIFVVTGIGGSYLGARAVLEALDPAFPEVRKGEKIPRILYAGENLSSDYHSALMELLDRHSVAVAVISKSGTTTEPAIAFRLIRGHLERKYGKQEARKRIIAVTDAAQGALRDLSGIEGYSTFVIPGDTGGRYSVLTPVGLLPVAVGGFDIFRLVEGAAEAESLLCRKPDTALNPASLYAATRNLLWRHGKTIEIQVTWQPNLVYFTEWWKQLFGESEGKEGKGIFPAGVNFSTDLHSLGQYIQQGPRNLFETVLSVDRPVTDLPIPSDPENHDGLNFLAGKTLAEVNRLAEQGTIMAHVEGGVPNIRISIPCLNEQHLGQLIYFFEFACGLSGYILGINPFDQPGVQEYKKNMFRLLGKP